MKLISLNVALFLENNKHVHHFLSTKKIDFICLQEVLRPLQHTVDKKWTSTSLIDSATPQLSHFFFGPNSVTRVFEQSNFHGEKHFRYDFGGLIEIGNYTKSRYPIQKGQVVFVENHFSFVTDFSKWPSEDYRSFLVTDYVINNKPLRIINYHGIWTRYKLGNKKSEKANTILLNEAMKFDGGIIICGDFNLFPDTPSMKLFQKSFINLMDYYNIRTTRPSSNELHHMDRNVVDYILVSNNVQIKSFEVLPCTFSDHLPLMLDFEL